MPNEKNNGLLSLALLPCMFFVVSFWKLGCATKHVAFISFFGHKQRVATTIKLPRQTTSITNNHSPCAVSGPVVRAIPVRDVLGSAVLQHEPGGQPGPAPGHGAAAVLRLEDHPVRLRRRLRRLLVGVRRVHQERAHGRGPARRRSSEEEGSEGR